MKNRVLYIVGFLVLMILVVFTITASLLFLIMINQRGSSKNVFQYTASEFNPSSNTTRMFIASMPRKLSAGEFISYFTNSGKYVTISPIFSRNEYECHSVCVCEEEDSENFDGRQRRITLVAARSIYLIVSAASSIMAISYAKPFFQNECNEILPQLRKLKKSTLCEVKEHIAECKRLMDVYETAREEVGYEINWDCKGSCKVSPEFAGSIVRVIREKCDECDKLVVEGGVKAANDGAAKMYFTRDHLRPFCKQVGSIQRPNNILQRVCISNPDNIVCVSDRDIVEDSFLRIVE